MFSNIGGKIKILASVTTWLGIIASIIIGFLNMPAGIFIMILGSLISWICSFLLYGFGQLIENSDKLVKHLIPEEKKQAPVYEPQPAEPWVCYNCGTSNHARAAYCIKCDSNRAWSEEKSKQA